MTANITTYSYLLGLAVLFLLDAFAKLRGGWCTGVNYSPDSVEKPSRGDDQEPVQRTFALSGKIALAAGAGRGEELRRCKIISASSHDRRMIRNIDGVDRVAWKRNLPTVRA